MPANKNISNLDCCGRYLLKFDKYSTSYRICLIEQISNDNVYEWYIDICDDYIDIDDKPCVRQFDIDDYNEYKIISKEVYDKVNKDVKSAEEEIENLINNSIIKKCPYSKGDCVVDKEIKSLCLRYDEKLTNACLLLSYHPNSFCCEEGPMCNDRWDKCPNVEPSVFDKCVEIWKETTDAIMNYLNGIYYTIK